MNTLPTLAVPSYRVTIPSTDEIVDFRPYLVKEEKILMIALESEDGDQIEDAIIDIVNECVSYDKPIRELTSYDLEFLFLQLRSKSVGEKIDILRVCEVEECKATTDVVINIEEAAVVNNDKKDNQIKLADDLTLEIKYPTLSSKIKYEKDTSNTEILIINAAAALTTIYYGEDTFDASLVSIEERQEFIEGLSTNQFSQVIEYLLDAPHVSYDGKFTCSKCGHKHEFNYTGLIDFFI
jgi:hypothetical protein